jgi:ATP-dependent exoDNAse (exonuclease V) beta subunit
MSLNKFTIQKNFAISAGAGSGKTYTLSRRYINALLGFDYFRECYEVTEKCPQKHESHFETRKPAKVRQIVTTTYTEAAALEMKGRIFGLIGKIIDMELSADDEDYDSIAEANTALESDAQRAYVVETLTQAFKESANAKISTIHAFCLDIIKANADLARIDTRLDIIKEDEKAKLLSDIIFEVLNDANNQETVLEITKEISMYFINGLIEAYVGSAKFRKNFNSFSQESITEEQYKTLIRELYPLPELTDEIEAEIDNASDVEVRRAWVEEYVGNFENFDAKPWNSFTVTAVYKSGKKKGEAYQSALGLGEKRFPHLTAFKVEMEGLLAHYAPVDADREALFFQRIEKLKTLLEAIKTKYDAALEERGKTDFDAIIDRAAEIIGRIEPDFRYIMVDEFQDTNQTQFDIVSTLKHKGANLFVVGDSKQSIYAFQGAEIEVFNNAVQDRTLFDLKPVDMSTNYRSDGVVLKTVNAIFDVLLQKDERLKHISQNFEAQAQPLHVSKAEKEKEGSFRYLITPQPYQSQQEKEENPDEISEMDSIAQFVSEIYYGKRAEYGDISKLIERKESAIAILFDSSTKMLELKEKLKAYGVAAKVSASDNFYHTKEVSDIFHLLKAVDILLSKKAWDETDKYYLAGAMRSNILRIEDREIKSCLEQGEVCEKLAHYAEVLPRLSLAQGVKYIYDDANIFGVYAHLDDVAQRVANLYKFLALCREYEEENETTLHSFLSLIENAVFFSEAKEEEAFYLSENTTSIELCTIHATKGLAYPMVLLANADKGLYSQVTGDALKHNSFTFDGERKEIVGFKIGDYVPLSHRVLKEIDKMKHLAEKKRLLYVALTRAKHDVVISATLKEKKEGDISLREDSYLSMIIDALDIDVRALYEERYDACIHLKENSQESIASEPVVYVEHTLEPITFPEEQYTSSATAKDEEREETVNREAAERGTIIHRIIELYWDRFGEHQEMILDKMGIWEAEERTGVVASMQKFYESPVYEALKQGAEAYFEKSFDDGEKLGYIDLVYFDERREGWVIVDFKTGLPTEEKEEQYQVQLTFYKDVLEAQGERVVETRLLWL